MSQTFEVNTDVLQRDNVPQLIFNVSKTSYLESEKAGIWYKIMNKT